MSQVTSKRPEHTQCWQKSGQVWCPSKKSSSQSLTGPLGAKMAVLPLESLPGGQRPTKHLTAVLHYVAMAVGILHAVLPSPGTLNLQRSGHKLRSAPPTPAPSPWSPASACRARQQGGRSHDTLRKRRETEMAQRNRKTLLTSSLVV